MKRTRICQWCFTEFPRTLGAVCKSCEERTKDQTLYALLYEDRSGISSIHADITEAQSILKEDASIGVYSLILRKVTGQAGARSELREVRSSFDEMWDKTEAALDRAEYESSTS